MMHRVSAEAFAGEVEISEIEPDGRLSEAMGLEVSSARVFLQQTPHQKSLQTSSGCSRDWILSSGNCLARPGSSVAADTALPPTQTTDSAIGADPRGGLGLLSSRRRSAVAVAADLHRRRDGLDVEAGSLQTPSPPTTGQTGFAHVCSLYEDVLAVSFDATHFQ
ncbi:unnamed protein product, partial [Protopolystoma xenopodis]